MYLNIDEFVKAYNNNGVYYVRIDLVNGFNEYEKFNRLNKALKYAKDYVKNNRSSVNDLFVLDSNEVIVYQFKAH